MRKLKLGIRLLLPGRCFFLSLIVSLFASIISFSFSGCTPWGDIDAMRDRARGIGTLELSFSFDSGIDDEDAILPSIEFDRPYRLRLSFDAKTKENKDKNENWDYNSDLAEFPVGEWELTRKIDLPNGLWDLTVTAYFSEEDNEEEDEEIETETEKTMKFLEAARTKTEGIFISKEKTERKSIILRPFQDGEGTFHWDIEFEEDMYNVTMSIYLIEIDENDEEELFFKESFILYNEDGDAIENKSYTELDTGKYMIEIDINNEVFETEYFYIRRNMKTLYEKAF